MINMSIGGADGPTAVFLAGKLGWGPINLFNLIIVVLILIPNIIYALTRGKNQKNRCTNRFMNILEQLGRYACMVLMIVNIGIDEFGFSSVLGFLIDLFGILVLLLMYWIVWVIYFIKERYWEQIALAIIPTAIFLLSGIMLQYWPLIVAAIVFGVAHIYVTSRNRCC